MSKFIFVTGGVASSVGKGISVASLGRLLKNRGVSVSLMKLEPYIEAIRQMRKDVGRRDVLYIHVTLLPYLGAAKELKTKPTQHSVKELLRVGIQPDVILCRSDYPVSDELREKIALSCNVETRAVIPLLTAETIYEVPLILEESGLGKYIVQEL